MRKIGQGIGLVLLVITSAGVLGNGSIKLIANVFQLSELGYQLGRIILTLAWVVTFIQIILNWKQQKEKKGNKK
ncbi:MAG: hypothetical protein ACRC6H_05830 [Culicoidibacterales bacterium]